MSMLLDAKYSGFVVSPREWELVADMGQDLSVRVRG